MVEADPEVATKAPESDAAAPMMSPDTDPDTQAPAAMGEHCTTDRPTPSGASTNGEISKISDVEVYISKPDDYPQAPARLLLLLSSGTGIHSVNNQLQADAFAAEGFVVLMPDQFGGDPAPNSSDPNSLDAASDATVIEQIKTKAAETVQSFMLDMWLARQTPEKVMPLLRKIITGAREEFADAIASGGGIYAVGYCFGAKYVLLLGAQPAEAPTTETKEAPATEPVQGMVAETPKKPAAEAGEKEEQPLAHEQTASEKAGTTIKVGALAHGTMITREDLQGMAVPVSMVCVENDQLFPDDVRAAGKTALETNKVEHEIEVYKKVPHGFAVVGEYEDTAVQEAQKSAFSQMLEWLKAH